MWAMFTDGLQVSRPFRTEDEARHQARKCGLADGEQLERNYEIRRIITTTSATPRNLFGGSELGRQVLSPLR